MTTAIQTLGWRLPAAAAVAALTGLAAAVRLVGLGHQSLWLDEFLWSELARERFGDIFWVGDGYPPLYGWMLHVLTRFGLDSDTALRLPSALAGIACVPLVYRVGERAGDHRAGLLAALLLALNPLAIWYSQEAGAYSLLMLCGLTGTLCLFRLQQGGEGKASLGYAASVLVGLGLHYYFAFVVLTQAALILVDFAQTRERRRAYLQCAAVTFVACLVWALPLAGDILHQTTEDAGRGLSWMALPYTAFTFVGGFSLGPPVRALHVARESLGGSFQVIAPHLLQTTAAIVGLGGLWLLALPRLRSGAHAMIVALAIAPPVVAWLASAVLVGYRPRYALTALPFVLLVAAMAIHSRHRVLSRVLVIVVASLQVSALATLHDPAYAREDNRRAAAIVDRLEGDAPIVLLGESAAPLERYVRDRTRALYLYPHHIPDRATLETNAAPHVAEEESVWLVQSRPWTVDPDGNVEAFLRESFVATEEAELAGVRATLYVRRSGDTGP